MALCCFVPRGFPSFIAMLLAVTMLVPLPAAAEPSTSGQTGLINMPSARIVPEGTWTLGYSFAEPYTDLYSTVSLFPFLELTLIGTRIMHVAGFADNTKYGDYKDKRFDVKLRLMEESGNYPALAIGLQDAYGTRVFGAEYIAANKRFGLADVTLGYARSRLTGFGVNDVGVKAKDNRLKGFFGGMRLKLDQASPFAFVIEHDATQYSKDRGVELSRADELRGKTNVGLEYQWQWLGAQISRQGTTMGVNGYVHIPLDRREYVPKLDEPEPYTKLRPRPTLAQWRADDKFRRDMALLLYRQDFQDIHIALDDSGTLAVGLANSRISSLPRAVGRAARTILLNAPTDIREIRVTYAVDSLPLATYSFFDLNRLQRYFNGQIPRRELAPYIDIRYAAADAGVTDGNTVALIDAMEVEKTWPVMQVTDDAGNIVSFKRQGADLGRFAFVPIRFSSFLNDPSGFFQFQIYSELSYSKQLASRLFLDSGMTLRLYDNFSDATVGSNSPLQHVRSDVDKYVHANRLKLSNLTLSRYFHPAKQVYARASGGLYEDMFGGAGGQVLYLPDSGHWAADFSVDALRQRDFNGGFKFQNYSTVTALAALHYKFPRGYNATVRAGKFLARDNGARFEFSRRFRSGIEMGGWYTVTDNQDLTASGSAGKPFRDKGVFLSVPFDVMLTRDTKAMTKFSVAEWGRDVGQMVNSPGDLYAMMDRPVRDLSNGDGLSRFGDVDDDYSLPNLGEGKALFNRDLLDSAGTDFSAAFDTLTSLPAWGKFALGVSAVGASMVLDNAGKKFADRHGENRAVRYLRNVGNNLPLVAGGAALAVALDGRDPRLADSGFAALKAGMTGYLATKGLKYAIHRSRPDEGRGHRDFNAASKGDSSMPSDHVTVMWAVTTPFAREYDAPWLYGVAAVSNFARVSNNRHWVSDTVASSLLGYGAGSLFWEWGRRDKKNAPLVSLSPSGISASWVFQ